MVRDEIHARFGLPAREAARRSTTPSTRGVPARRCARTARAVRARHGIAGGGDACSCSSAPATSARASRRRSRRSPRCRRRAHLVVVGREKHARALSRASRARSGVRGRVTLRRPADRPEAVLRRRRRVRAADALRPAAQRGARGDGLRRCRWSPARSPARPSSSPSTTPASSARSRDAAALADAHARAARPRDRARAWARTPARRSLPLTPAAMTLQLVLLYKELLERERRDGARQRTAGAERAPARHPAADAPGTRQRVPRAASGGPTRRAPSPARAAAADTPPAGHRIARLPSALARALRRCPPRRRAPYTPMTGLHLYRRLLALRPALPVGVRPRRSSAW